MAQSFDITKVSIRERLVVDAKVSMKDPQDYDFSPRASLSGTTLSIVNETGEPSSTFELDEEQIITAERDRMLELRVKFNVQGMHGVLTHRTTADDRPEVKEASRAELEDHPASVDVTLHRRD